MAAELKDRADLGNFLNELGLTARGAEIGVYRGDFSMQVISSWKGREWHLIDPWELSPEFLQLHGAVTWDMQSAWATVLRRAEASPRLKVHRMKSEDWDDPELFDVVYLDAGHSFEAVWKDLGKWWPRVKPGGLLCGHDYLDDWRWSVDPNKGVLFGVRSAVDRFAAAAGRVVATTNEEFPTWWFLKPAVSIQPRDILVCSMSTADISWADMTAENHQRYCNRWGYQYQHVRLEKGTRPVSWEKLPIIREALQRAKFVMWIDADAIFQRLDLSLQRFWDGISPFIFLKDNVNGLNMGVFFVRQCQEAVEFLDKWNSMTEFTDHHWWENGAIIELEKRGELVGTVLPHRLANSYPHLPGCWGSADFVAHFAGLLPPIRLQLIRDFLARSPVENS